MPKKSNPPTFPADCSRLKVMYEEKYDCMTIAHMTDDGKVVSQVCLSPEDAYSYAQSIIDVYDESMGIT